MRDGVTKLIGVALVALWLWGAVSYLQQGQTGFALAAFVVPPLGVLHGIGLI